MPLPFDLPRLGRGHAELTSRARALGETAARAAEAALAALVQGPVTVAARATAAPPLPRAGVAQVALELAAVPCPALLEVEADLVVQVVARLAGDGGVEAPALALTPLEETWLELAALAALDGVCGVADVERALGPRLARGAPEVGSALVVELELAVLGARGGGRLLLPPAAVRAVQGDPAGAVDEARVTVPASLRRGSAGLTPEELDALAPGDVVLLDPEPAPDGDGPVALVLPGGARVVGQLAEDTLEIEEIDMNERRLQLPIRVEVELARVELTVADLARLEPGATLQLALDRRGIVTLRVGERAIATGELVDVDGAIGVRVTTVEVEP